MNAIVVYIKLLVAAELLAAVTGFVTWHKWKHSYFKWLVIYLGIIAFMDIVYYTVYKFHYLDAAGIIKTIQPAIEILFISWFFYKTLAAPASKLPFAGAAFYLLALLLEKTMLKNNAYYFQSLSYTVGTLFILLYLIIFFTQLVRSKNIVTFKQLTIFWVACGMLVFYLGTFPFYGLYNELAKDIDLFIAVAWVATSLNYCMYLLFTAGFIWGKPH